MRSSPTAPILALALWTWALAPAAAHAGGARRTVDVLPGGTLRLGNRSMTIKEFDRWLAPARSTRKEELVRITWIIRADENLAYGRLRRVLEVLQARGVSKILFAPLPAAPGRRKAHRLLAEAASLLESGRIDAAVAALSRAIASDPRLAQSYLQRGRVYQRLGRIELALADYGRALAIDPRMAEAYLRRGKLRLAAGLMKSAVEDLERALRIRPDFDAARAAHEAARTALRGLQGGRRLPNRIGTTGKKRLESAPARPVAHRGVRVRIRLDDREGGLSGSVIIEKRFRGVAQLKSALGDPTGIAEVVLDASPRVPYRSIVEVLGMLWKARIERVVFTTRRPK